MTPTEEPCGICFGWVNLRPETREWKHVHDLHADLRAARALKAKLLAALKEVLEYGLIVKGMSEQVFARQGELDTKYIEKVEALIARAEGRK
jgi:hypothetical protein